jgi:cytochrome P450
LASATLPAGPRTPRLAQAVLWGLRYPAFTRAGHERYGSTFTIRPGTMPPIVLTTDRDAIKQLLTGDPLKRRHANDVIRPLIEEPSLMLLAPAEHLERRKLLLPPFHGERVRGYADLMRELMEREVGTWRPGDTVAVMPAALNVTIEVILQAVLGVADAGLRERLRQLIDDLLLYPLGPIRRRLGTRHARPIRTPRIMREASAFAAALPTPAVMTYFPEFKTQAWWNVSTKPWWRLLARLHALLDEHIAATRSDPRLADREDILAMLVQARDEDGNGLSDEALREDLITLIGAGHETTAAAIGWGAVLLAHNDDVQARVAAAARDDDDAYLSATVKEVLRLRTPIPVGSVRVLDEPLTIDGHALPAGTTILVDAWGLHHDPALYPDPERFSPERFLDGQPEPYAFLPFGGGAHRCLGSALAELEINVALTTMLRSVRLLPAERALAPIARRGITMVPQGGGRVTIG